jgi:hypothetical protein
MARRRVFKIGWLTIVTREVEPEPESCASVVFTVTFVLLSAAGMVWLAARLLGS